MGLRLGTGARIAVANIDLAHQIKPRRRRVAMRRLNLAIELLVAASLVDQRVDLRKRDVVLGRPAQRFLTLRTDQKRRVWALHQWRR